MEEVSFWLQAVQVAKTNSDSGVHASTAVSSTLPVFPPPSSQLTGQVPPDATWGTPEAYWATPEFNIWVRFP